MWELHYMNNVKSSGSQLTKKNGYGCPVPYCREKYGSWWTCFCCDSNVCKRHEVFNGRIVPYCAICCPQQFGLIYNSTEK